MKTLILLAISLACGAGIMVLAAWLDRKQRKEEKR